LSCDFSLFKKSTMAKIFRIKKATKGNTDIIDITDDVNKAVKKSGIKEGVANIFVVGSTAGLTTIEYEPGLEKDLKAFFERIIPGKIKYNHEEKWHDDNGHSHIRASVLKPDLSVPIINNELALGTWQQIVLVDFDTRGREREIIISIV
jgi:secondary thiamine-phosphate synthase enzyme